MRHAPAFALCFFALQASAQLNPEIGFSRIIPGWTNYSTAFNATHDLGSERDFATVGAVYVPPVDVSPVAFATIVIWLGDPGEQVDFSKFSFRVGIWSSLAQFQSDPLRGDLASHDFLAPTGGDLSTPDAWTKNGRPCYLLRFDLPPSHQVLTRCQTYVVGFASRTDVSVNGELFVPTANSRGHSDVQAGSLVPFGFTYVINSGGATMYYGQLAMDFMVFPTSLPPRLSIARRSAEVEISWPSTASCYTLQAADALATANSWQVVPEPPAESAGLFRVRLRPAAGLRWFRLAKDESFE